MSAHSRPKLVNVNRTRPLAGRWSWYVPVLVALLVSTTVNLRADVPAVVAPFEKLLERPVTLRPELRGQHPRVFFTAASLAELRARTTTHRELWQQTTGRVRAVEEEPYPPGAPELDRAPAQYNAAYTLAEATYVFAVGRDPRHLSATKKWLFAIIKYDPWGYTYRTPNVDLPPAHLLYAVAFAYDALYHDLSIEERAAVRAKLTRQSRLMYEYFKYKPKKRYAYSQNHSFIPMAGLGVAAFALLDEEPEAAQWARLARAIYDRVLTTFGTDGYYYEGFHYLVFSFHWIVRYLDALEHAAGEDLYPRMRERFLPIKYYVAHSMLPGGNGVFDFGDTGRGAAERTERRARGVKSSFNSGYETLYRLAAKYGDAQTQGVAEWLRRDLGHETWEAHWAFHAYDGRVPAAAVASLPTSHHFEDNGTAFWRSDWSPAATAFAFRCAPPEGHAAAGLIPLVPDWRQSTGHAHPDANSFIIYAHDRYLTGDTGYTGVKLTSDHNTVLVGGQGQERDGRHEVFKDVPYARLADLRLADVFATPQFFYARGEAAAAYAPDLKLTRFARHFMYVAPDYFLVWDELAAAEPRAFTWLLNAEAGIKQLGPTEHVLNTNEGGAGSRLFVRQLAPGGGTSAQIAPQMVTAQGRPGSIEQGTQEQRGIQLGKSTGAAARSAEFLHFLLPEANGEAALSRPRVELLTDPAGTETRGVKIDWPDGSSEWVLLRQGEEGTSDASVAAGGLSTDGSRAVLRLTSAGAWRRLSVQEGTRLDADGTSILRSTRPVNAALETSARGGWRGAVNSAGPVDVVVNVSRRPRALRVNGLPAQFKFDTRQRTVTLRLRGASANRIEAD
ncbi:MAG: heparinase II/III domain-containing protein [Pyrinomonadaceae bacterium]